MILFGKEVLNPFLNSIENFGAHHAFCINDRFYTYSELAETISKIRSSLQRYEIAGKNVGLIANDDLETYASIYAIWLEGGAYVPLLAQQPVERNLEIINQANVALVLNSDANTTVPSIETIYSKKLEFKKRELSPKSVPDEYLAIVLFTSGSTGKPKGVPLTRANLAAFVKAFWDIGYSIDQNDRFLQIADLSFDGSIISFLFPAIRGACVYTVPQNHMRQILIAELLSKYSLTVAFMVPSNIRSYKPYFDEIKLPSLRYNLIVGEALPLVLVNEWSRCVPNAIIDNAYGPAENTVICSWYRYNRGGENKSYNGVMSIGKSMAGGLMIVTDDENRELTEYQKGELCLSGSQLTPGYLNNPVRNKESFFIDKQGRRFYRTGDICFKDSDGDVMFCGRADSQVKVQGIRIELGEIEFYTHEILQGQNAVAISFENKTGNTEIALIVEGELKDKQLVSKQMKSKMPQYMVPTKILCHPKFPLNANGKTDRIALKNWLIRQNE